jgi:hypothetical protein
MFRDFKQRVGIPVERCLELVASIERKLAAEGGIGLQDRTTLTKLAAFYAHLGDLARGYVKDAAAREEQATIGSGWVSEVDALLAALGEAGDGRA